MSTDDKGDLTTPRVDKAGPAAVNGNVLSVSCKETDRGVIKWLTCILQNCRRVESKEYQYQAIQRAECTKPYLSISTKQVNSKYVLNLLLKKRGSSESVGGLTLAMNSKHQWSVTWVEIKQHRGPNQVLREVPQQRHSPNCKGGTYFDDTLTFTALKNVTNT